MINRKITRTITKYTYTCRCYNPEKCDLVDVEIQSTKKLSYNRLFYAVREMSDQLRYLEVIDTKEESAVYQMSLDTFIQLAEKVSNTEN